MKKNLILLSRFHRASSIALLSGFVTLIFLGSAISISAQTLTLPNPLAVDNFKDLIANIVTYIAGLIGGIAVLVFIWAGILYLTSGANPGNIQKANKAVLYAIIGLGIALAGTGLIVLIQTIITG